MTLTTVYRWWAEPMALGAALEGLARAVPLEGATAFLASPDRFVVGRVDVSGAVAGSDGRGLGRDGVFEARVFGPEAELRWLGTRSGGHAVIVAEAPVNPPRDVWRAIAVLQGERLPGHYLLWGEGVANPPALAGGWSRLAAARIGVLDVPVAGVGPEHRVQIESVEYLVEQDDHGNMAVAEERLVRLVVLDAGAARAGSP